jgi:hypothetical protein
VCICLHALNACMKLEAMRVPACFEDLHLSAYLHLSVRLHVSACIKSRAFQVLSVVCASICARIMFKCLHASSAENVHASDCPHQAHALSVYVRVFASIKLKR